MSLAFVVMAAINGSTGARLSVGLSGTLNGVSPTASGFSPIRGDGASRQRHCAGRWQRYDEGRSVDQLGVFFDGPQDAVAIQRLVHVDDDVLYT